MQAYIDPDQSATLDDWSFSLAFAQDQARYAFPIAPMAPCGNTACTNSSYARYCSPACLAIVEPEVLGEVDEDDYYADPDSDTLLGLKTLADTQHALDGDLVRKACGMPPPAIAAAVAPLPEAPAAISVKLAIAGYADCILTLRDSSETRLLERLETVLQRFPVQVPVGQAAVVSDPGPVCPVHHIAMQEQTNQRGSWFSHKTADGWCKGKVQHG